MCKQNRSVHLLSFLSMWLLYLPHILGTHFYEQGRVILMNCRPHLTFTCLTQGKEWHMGKTQMMWLACGEVNCWSERFVFVVSAEDKPDEFTIERMYSHGTVYIYRSCVLCVCVFNIWQEVTLHWSLWMLEASGYCIKGNWIMWFWQTITLWCCFAPELYVLVLFQWNGANTHTHTHTHTQIFDMFRKE